MNLRRRGILVVVLALVTTALSAIVPAVVWKNLVTTINGSPTPQMKWDLVGGKVLMWAVDSERLGSTDLEIVGTGVSDHPDATDAWRGRLPGWVRLPERASGAFNWFGQGYGWPLIALTTHQWEEYLLEGVSETETFDRWSFFFMRMPVTLPTRVYWPGMLGNLAVFAAFWAALLIVPGAVRQARRKRRGACLECGYDVRSVVGGVCPECGTSAQGAERKVRVTSG